MYIIGRFMYVQVRLQERPCVVRKLGMHVEICRHVLSLFKDMGLGIKWRVPNLMVTIMVREWLD